MFFSVFIDILKTGSFSVNGQSFLLEKPAVYVVVVVEVLIAQAEKIEHRIARLSNIGSAAPVEERKNCTGQVVNIISSTTVFP